MPSKMPTKSARRSGCSPSGLEQGAHHSGRAPRHGTAVVVHGVNPGTVRIDAGPYRNAMPTAEAIKRLRAAAGTQFDPDVVAAFVRCSDRGEIPPSYAD